MQLYLDYFKMIANINSCFCLLEEKKYVHAFELVAMQLFSVAVVVVVIVTNSTINFHYVLFVYQRQMSTHR